MNVFKVAVSSGHQIMPEGLGRHFKGDLSLRSRQRTALVLAYLCKAEILGHRSVKMPQNECCEQIMVWE